MNDLENALEALSGLKPWTGEVPAGNLANFLGVLTSLDYFADPASQVSNATSQDEDLERVRAAPYSLSTRVPEVGDGESFFEWVDVITAVRAARERFVMVELGGGYGSRSVDAHAALSMLGPLPEMFVVVEAMPQHIAWAHDHFTANGLDPSTHWLVNALVNETGRPELFAHSSGVYYSNILDAPTRQRVFDAISSEGYLEPVARNLILEGRMGVTLPVAGGSGAAMDVDFISAMRLDTILAPLPLVDFLDVDIQFAEERVIPDAIDVIGRKVKRAHIGTHAPPIHQMLEGLLRERGWQIVFSYLPYTNVDTPYGAFATKDGILSAVNPTL